MSEKPTAGFVLSLIGGIFIFLVGLGLAALGTSWGACLAYPLAAQTR